MPSIFHAEFYKNYFDSLELLGEVRRHVDLLQMTGGGKKAKKKKTLEGKGKHTDMSKYKEKNRKAGTKRTQCAAALLQIPR